MSDQSDPTINAYRIAAVHGGFEAQMLYQVGYRPHQEWFPLNPDGYWSDPDGFSFGLIVKRHIFDTQAEAHAAILKAKSINDER